MKIFDRVVPIGSNTLRTLLGNIDESGDGADLDDFFGGLQALQITNSDLDDSLTAEDILGISESERANLREDDIFAEAGRQSRGVSGALSNVTENLLGFGGHSGIRGISWCIRCL